MKRLLLPLILLTSLFSNKVFATHAYRSQVCHSDTHTLIYKGNYPVGGYYGVSLNTASEDEDDVTALDIYDEETPPTLEDADIIFTETLSEILDQKPTENDCWFEHDEWTSKKVITFNQMTEAAAAKLGLKAGQIMTFICEETTDFPNGNECEDKTE